LKCINSIKASDYPGEMEIIAVDDGSTDGTRELLKEIDGITPILKEKNEGKAASINKAAKIARGEVLVCVDSDSYPEPNAFREGVNLLMQSPEVGAVTCFIRVENPNSLLKKIQDIEYLTGFGFSQITTRALDAIFVTPGPTTIFRKSVFLEVGGYDEENITEDLEMAWRLRKHGYRIDYTPEAVSYTDVPGDLPTLFRQRMRWYRGKLFNLRKHKDMMLNPKYGYFGTFIFPFSFTAEFAGIVLSFSFLYLILNQLFWSARYVWSNFMLGAPLLDLSSMLMVGGAVVLMGLILVSPWFLAVYLSHVIGGKRFTLSDAPAAALFLLFYGTIISFFYCISFFKEVNRSDYRWK
ncbi:MAG TPA: glycosyltransferase family 2 protein, partial [Candidatus Bilamarchaeaceae archaeon]|nr:glycosyltransferase family 2 protein [Candidatus Bilamarchaeaceae archaeon]